MKELTLMEMDYVSGGDFTPPAWGTGYSWDFSSLDSAVSSLLYNAFQASAGLIVGCVGGTLGGMAVGAGIGDNGGGVLGLGMIGSLGGAIIGGVAGFVGGATAGFFGGFDYVAQVAGDVMYSAFNGSLSFW